VTGRRDAAALGLQELSSGDRRTADRLRQDEARRRGGQLVREQRERGRRVCVALRRQHKQVRGERVQAGPRFQSDQVALRRRGRHQSTHETGDEWLQFTVVV